MQLFTKSLLMASMVICSTLSAMEQIEPIDRNKLPQAQDLTQEEICPICQEKSETFDADQKMITRCCKKFMCKKDAQKLLNEAENNKVILADSLRRTTFLDQNEGWRESELKMARCPWCRKKLVVKLAVLDHALISKPLCIIDSNGDEHRFSLQDSLILQECATLNDLILATIGTVDLRPLSLWVPVTKASIKTLIACIEDPTIRIDPELTKAGHLFLLAHQLDAPLLVQWNLAQVCYKNLTSGDFENNITLRVSLENVLSLGNYLQLAFENLIPHTLTDQQLTVSPLQKIISTNNVVLSDDCLDYYKNVKELVIDNNDLTDFSIKNLKNIFPNLNRLFLKKNKINYLHKEQFEGITNKFYLNLACNPIVALEADCFDNKYFRSCSNATIFLEKTYITQLDLKQHLTLYSPFIDIKEVREILAASVAMGSSWFSKMFVESLSRLENSTNKGRYDYFLKVLALTSVPLCWFASFKATLAYFKREDFDHRHRNYHVKVINYHDEWILFKDSPIKRWWNAFKRL